MRRKIIFFWAALVSAGIFYFHSPARAGEADSGRALYLQYCASCHGEDARGKGPMTSYLKVKVPDLTALKKNNKGVFPLARVMSSIDGSRAVRGHGDPVMPVWGEVFRKELKDEKYPELTTLRKTQAIADYLSTLQR
jgi:mono/diheme cytochrome c family protein